MGCTSSAPNMANPRTAEKSIQFEDEYITNDSNNVEEIIYRAADNINELPRCDTLPEPVLLVSNKSTSSFKVLSVTDNSVTENKVENIDKVNSKSTLHQEEKESSSKLEGVVGKMFELHTIEHTNDAHDTQSDEKKVVEETPNNEVSEENQESVKESGEGTESKDATKEDGDKNEEDPEEALSPSQSETSRATRWEALADIAAELPASLTIDPITGQIYSLSR